MNGPQTSDLVEIGQRAGLAAVGVASAEILEPARTVLHQRKRAGLAGEMQFTYRNPDRSTDPDRTLKGARSLVAGAWGYGRLRKPKHADPERPVASVARYSWHNHYADLEQALEPIAEHLRAHGHQARIVADTNALVDRNIAWSAGLGWYGKNSNLLLPGQGSWFVLGTVVTDAELEPTGPPIADGCGSCNQCIEDCPTDAIIGPGIVDARRCLAWIVQAGGAIPLEYREAIGHRLYGCDDCQDVCPPNRSADRESEIEDGDGPEAQRERALVDLHWVLSATDDEIIERHGRWYIAERNVDYIRRTALVVLGNVASPDSIPIGQLLTRYLGHQLPLLRGHAVWAAKRLGRSTLLDALADERDTDVLTELSTTVPARFEPEEWVGVDA